VDPVWLKFHGSSFLVASSCHPREDVRNESCVSGSWNLENDTTHGQMGITTHCSRPPRSTDQVSAWQAEQGSRPTRATSSRGCRACRRGCYEDATRKLLPWNFSFSAQSTMMTPRHDARYRRAATQCNAEDQKRRCRRTLTSSLV